MIEVWGSEKSLSFETALNENFQRVMKWKVPNE